MGTILKRSTGIKFELHKGQVGELNELEAARRSFCNELERAHKETAAWRWVGTIASTVAGMAICLFLWTMTFGIRDHVHVARYNELDGTEEWLPSAPVKPVKPEQSVIHGVVRNWVEAVRAISNDRVVYDQNWERVKDYSTQVAWRQLEAFHKEQDERQVGGRRVMVTTGKFFPVSKSQQSFRITWKETAWDLYGQCLEEESGYWELGVRIADFSSQTAQDEMSLRRKQRNFRNLFGVFIDEPLWKPTVPEGGKRACDSM